MRDTARTAGPGASSSSSGAPSAPHWASLNESTFVAGIRVLFWIYRVLGRAPFRLCLYPVVAYYWATRSVARRSSLEYLRRLHAHQCLQVGGSHRPVPGAWQSLQHLLAFADTILDKLLAMSGALGGEALRSVGEEGLLALKDQGRGAIIVTGHVGCMELCRLSAERHRGVRLNVLVHTVHAERFNRLLQRLHPDSPVRLIQVTEISPATAIMLSDKVAQGEYVAIAGDRVPVSHGTTTVPAAFLGAQARWPVGPYVLAALLKCPLYAMACVREHDPVHGSGYVLRVQHLADTVVLPRGRREEAMAHHAQAFAHWLETVLVRSPMSWFNFFPFWRQAEQPPVMPEQ